MSALSRAIVLVAAAAFLITALVPATGAAGGPFNTTDTPTLTTQYDPGTVLSAGVTLDNFSSVIQVDPWVKDFDIGDMNGDGLTDLVVISNYTNSICIYNRTLDGWFNPIPWRIEKSTLSDLRDVAVGDLNNDGLADVAVTGYDSGLGFSFTVFYQNHAYSQASSTTKYTVNTEPFEIRIGNCSSGINQALALVCRGDPSVAGDDSVEVWRYPFTDQSFRQMASISSFKRTELLALGDVNNDGLTELVVADKGGPNVQIFSWGGSSWSSTQKPIVGSAVDIETGDIMGTGRTDLAFANGANSQIYVYANNGAGLDTDSQVQIVAHSLSSIAFGEFSGMPGADLATISTAGNVSAFERNSVASWYGTPNLTFPVNVNPVKALVDRSVSQHEGLFVLSAGNPNRNGSIEFFPANPALKGNANRNIFTTAQEPTQVAVGNGMSGHRIEATSLASSTSVRVDDGTSGASNTLTVPGTPGPLTFGSFDPDTLDDVGVVSSSDDSFIIYLGSSLFNSSSPTKTIILPVASPSALVSASIRNDGFSDAIIGYDGGIYVLYNNENSTLFSTALSETLGTTIDGLRSVIAVGDFNADGIGGDIAALNSGSSTVELYFRKASGAPGSFYNHMPDSTLTRESSHFTAMAAADLSGDGRLDIAVLDGDYVRLYRQPSYGFTISLSAEHGSLLLQEAASAVTSGDVNDDGKADLAVTYSSLPGLSIFLRTGDLTFKRTYNYTTGGCAAGILASDVNGDGRTDMVVCVPASHSLSFWYQKNLVPDANATASTYVVYEGTPVTFSGAGSKDSSSDISSLNYTWTFGTSAHAYGIMTAFAFPDHGRYLASLKVTDRGGLSNWSNLTINVLERTPVPDFTYAPPSPVEGVSVAFTDTSSSYDDLVNWTWSFGDGHYAYAEDCTHVFTQMGDYQVKLTVRDNDGTTANITKTVHVADTSPNAAFTMDHAVILEGGIVNFTDASTAGYDPIESYSWSFGDGGYSDQRNPSHIYHLQGDYTVVLTVRDSDGITDSTSDIVHVTDIPPTAAFSYAPSAPTEGDEVAFSDESTHWDDLTNWTWSFGDGSFSFIQNPMHVFVQTGDYEVNLTVCDTDGVTDSASATIHVLDTTPSANFTYDPPAPIEGQPVQFQDLSTSYDPIMHWNWSFGDGWFNEERNPTHVFVNSGNYSVTLTATDRDGMSGSVMISVAVGEAPLTANFTYSPDPAYEGVEIHFQSTSASYDPIILYEWTIQGGDSQSGLNLDHINHTFASSGDYLVTLTITDNDGGTDTIEQPVHVLEQIPIVSFTFSPASPREGDVVTFNDTSSSYDRLVNWTWSFDDGSISYLRNTTHRFGDGDHVVTLTVRDIDGTTANNKSHVIVSDLWPVASFTNSTAVEGRPAYFNDTSYSAWDRIVAWLWEFGDGANATYQNATHAYPSSGWFNVSLTVQDVDEHTDTTYRLIWVVNVNPVADFEISSPRIENQIVRFTDHSFTFNNITSWRWIYGDGGESVAPNNRTGASHVYQVHGWYNVTLTVTEADGSSGSTTRRIYVDDSNPAIVSFRTEDGATTYNEDGRVTFWVSATPTNDSIVRYEWDFEGNGTFVPSSPALSNHTAHVYPQKGTFVAAVRVWDSDSFSVAYLWIDVRNLAPSADFSYRNDTSVSGLIWFDASRSSDTASDQPSLLFSWNFDDNQGWTDWSSSRIVSHAYGVDGRYNVSVQVRDDDGELSAVRTHDVVVDRTSPDVVMVGDGSNATVGEPILITVRVSDRFGVGEVVLYYRVGNGSLMTVPMTQKDEPGLYFAQIPPQNETTLVYWVNATDTSNNAFTTQQIEILVRPAAPSDSLWALVAVLAAALVAALFLAARRASITVDEVFVIYENGCLMAHETRRLKPGMDDEVLSSMLVAIQNFVKESFKDEGATALQRLDFGKKKILVERGGKVYLAVVLHGHNAGKVPQRMQQVISEIEEEFRESLDGWDGDLEKVRGVKDKTERLFEGIRLLPKRGKVS